MTRQRGFTLIEMAVVLVIIGLVIGGGLMSIGPILDRTHSNQTNTNLDQAESALVLFVIRNNRLPCPADGSFLNNNAFYGMENGGAAPPTANGACTVALTNAVIPWRTLGLDDSYSVDGWGNRFAYFPANAQFGGTDTLVDNSSGVTAACGADPTGATCTLCLSRTTGAASASSRATLCDPTVPGATTTGLSPSYPYGNYLPVYVAAQNPTSELTTPQPVVPITTANTNVAQAGGRAAYVLISHGRSGLYSWAKGGKQIKTQPSDGYVTKAFNETGTAGPAGIGFVQGPTVGSWPPGPGTNAVYFDDIVRWRTPAMIIQLCGSGACGNP
jgi:prepilin-type N-terminal cleavage/methylation domain-containing protein